MNWRAFRRPIFWVDALLALALLVFGLRAHSQMVSDPTPAEVERHLESHDRLIDGHSKQLKELDEKVAEMWGIGLCASALAMGSVALHLKK